MVWKPHTIPCHTITYHTIPYQKSLLSSTDSSQNPAESGQFLEFQRNQIWQRGLPNWSSDPDGILNGIQILPEWFLESPGRNEFPEFNGMESCPPTTNTYNAQPCPNQLSVFADDQFGHGQQPPTLWRLICTFNPRTQLSERVQLSSSAQLFDVNCAQLLTTLASSSLPVLFVLVP